MTEQTPDTDTEITGDTGTSSHTAADTAVLDGGAYAVLHKRLQEQGLRLRAIADALNAERLQTFGSSAMEVVGRLRVRTENNCVARDIVQVGDVLLFGYNVFLGLQTNARIEDVFSLYKLVEGADGFDVTPVDIKGSFLGGDSFGNDFRELYAYYKHARLLELQVHNGRLLAAFQIGERVEDVRVFRWEIATDGSARYVDNRGERDIALPAQFDFEWTRATREMAVGGRHPHLNILDTVFVETVGGDLTVKIENNTEDGLGIWREPVDDKTQSLDDAQVDFARVGSLVLLRVLPYRESVWRHLVYNTLTRQVQRIDAIGQACVQLPEDHGIVFPGGYALQNGETRLFDQPMAGMRFRRAIRSPNGEDMLYVFYEPEDGRVALCTYNMIQRALQPPLLGHGYAHGDDGRMVVFSAESDEPTRVHPMQIWRTPFCSDEYAARQPAASGFMGRIGNAELVRGISDLMSLVREIGADAVSVQRYERLVLNTRRLFDQYYWIGDPACQRAEPLLREIVATSEAVVDEYEKVESIREQSARALREAQSKQRTLLDTLRPDDWRDAQAFVDALNAIGAQRGHLLTIREFRYIDTATIDAMEAALLAEQARIGTATAAFLASDQAFVPFAERLQALDAQAAASTTVAQLDDPLKQMQAMASDLDMLSELMAGLAMDDATQRTRIVESVSEIYARLNQARARAEQRRKQFGSGETVAQFGAQFALFAQSIASALAAARDPQACEDQLSRLLVQLESLESQFGEHEEFLGDIVAKREELLESFEARRQTLLDERQRKGQSLADAAARILEGLGRRTARLATADELNAFFAGDPLILKLRDLVQRLRALDDSVRADDIEARLKSARDQSVRAQRDRSELFEDGGNVIRLGPRHRFSVNTQALDLTVLPREDGLALHLTGTDFFAPLHDERLDTLREYWQATLESESPSLYRGEFLAGAALDAADAGRDGLTVNLLRTQAVNPDDLARTLRDFAAPRYREGYEKGIHDHDAALILRALLPLRDSAGLLVHAPAARAFANLFWAAVHEDAESAACPARWPQRARSARDIVRLFGSDAGLRELRGDIAVAMRAFRDTHGVPRDATLCEPAADYLVEALTAEHPLFPVSRYARALVDALKTRLDAERLWDGLQQALAQGGLAERLALATHWIDALCADAAHAPLRDYAPEAAALLLGDDATVRASETDLRATVEGLLGEHPRIVSGAMTLGIDDFNSRLRAHRTVYQPGVQRFAALRQEIVARERERLKLDEFQARPLTSFVRNRLIDSVYLPVIGDNLAKQMGTVGESKRSDLMGLLMLISPPGYGKTTLMEYVAHRLGLVFMKINGPALGHAVRSLDPAQAPDATARQELEKLNLALEMGSNVMLYVDDIQHTHPEFLQKFISLCDGTRRIEGVWQGRTRTYDLRGKKFCVVMAGNPYTESGEVFKIPDMLANRADIYNLGDVLGGMEDAFKLSYLENGLTSNPVLAPLATRDLADLYRLVDKAEGRAFSANALAHAYGKAEIDEIVSVLERLIGLRDIVYAVNQQYIASAAQADGYRTEPPFRLQGSYRNMNKLAEKVSAVMNAAELRQLVDDHYTGEAQLLTTGAEENLLKLAELRGTLDATQTARWAQIKRDFLRVKAMGADDADAGQRVVAQLADLVEGVRALQRDPDTRAADAPAADAPPWQDILAQLARMADQRTPVPVAEPASSPSDNDDGAGARALAALPLALEDALHPLVEGLQLRAKQQALLLAEIAERLRAPPPADAGGERTASGLSGLERPSPERIEMERALAEFADRLAKRDKRRKRPT
jgi:hypothetical protein